MPQTSTSWRKGQSGNLKGRPPMRTRPLATVLRELGAEEVANRENRTAVASLIWQAMRTGSLILDSGEKMKLSPKEWLDLVKWVHLHVDGGLQRKNQYAEANDQQAQLEEIFESLETANRDVASQMEPKPATNSAVSPQPDPSLHTQS